MSLSVSSSDRLLSMFLDSNGGPSVLSFVAHPCEAVHTSTVKIAMAARDRKRSTLGDASWTVRLLKRSPYGTAPIA